MNNIIFDAVDSLDPAIIDEYFLMKEQLSCRPKVLRNSNKWKRCVTAAACFVVIISCLFAGKIINNRDKQGGVDDIPDIGNNNNPGLDNWYPSPDPGAGDIFFNEAKTYYQWNGIMVSEKLYSELNKIGCSDYLAIRILKWPDRDFVYNGMTEEDMNAQVRELQEYRTKLEQLCNDAEYLVQGEDCYLQGTWSKHTYETKLEYYGELIDVYIVDGVFLRDEAIAECEKIYTDATVLINSYYNAQHELMANTLYEELNENYLITIETGSRVVIYLTKSELAELKLDNKESYLFELNGEDDEAETFRDEDGNLIVLC